MRLRSIPRLLSTAAMLALVVGLAAPAGAAGYGLDPYFGTSGVTLSAPPRMSPRAERWEDGRIALVPGGGIVVAGTYSDTACAYGSCYGGRRIVVGGFDADGHLNGSFGGPGANGWVTLNFFASHGFALQDAEARAVAVDAHGRIVVAGDGCGRFGYFQGECLAFDLMRFTSDGQLDFSFGDNGLVQTALGGTTHDLAGIALAPDGSIYAAGTGGDGRIEVVKYKENGRLDTSFGSGGIATWFFTGSAYGSSASAAAVVIGPDQKPIVFGTLCMRIEGQDQFCNFLEATFTTGGQPDSWVPLTGAYWSDRQRYFGRAATIQSDGKLLVAGTRDGSLVMMRFWPSATKNGIDTGFGSGGLVVDANFPNQVVVDSVVVDPRGAIWVAGETGGLNPYDPEAPKNRGWIARYSSAGVRDGSFGTDGLGRIPQGDPHDTSPLTSIALQPNGQVVAGGSGDRWHPTNEPHTYTIDEGFLLARFSPPQIRSVVAPTLDKIVQNLTAPLAKVLRLGEPESAKSVGKTVNQYVASIWKLLP